MLLLAHQLPCEGEPLVGPPNTADLSTGHHASASLVTLAKQYDRKNPDKDDEADDDAPLILSTLYSLSLSLCVCVSSKRAEACTSKSCFSTPSLAGETLHKHMATRLQFSIAICGD